MIIYRHWINEIEITPKYENKGIILIYLKTIYLSIYLYILGQYYAQKYIAEFTLKNEYLGLSPYLRNLSKIPVMLVLIEPTLNKCFNGSINQFFLKNIIGYDNLLISSVKLLKHDQDRGGYLRYSNYFIGNITYFTIISGCFTELSCLVKHTGSRGVILRKLRILQHF